MKGGKLVACPDTADINVGDRVLWLFRPDLDADYMQIEFQTKNGRRGPFPQKANDPDNPEQGVYRKTGKGDVETAEATPIEGSLECWKYTASLRNDRGELVQLDPIIIVRATQS